MLLIYMAAKSAEFNEELEKGYADMQADRLIVWKTRYNEGKKFFKKISTHLLTVLTISAIT